MDQDVLWRSNQNRFSLIHKCMEELVEDYNISTFSRPISELTCRTSDSGNHLFGKYFLSRIEVPERQRLLTSVYYRGADSLKKPLRALLIRLLPHKESPYDKSLRV
jgi:hypothetical protein